MRVDEIPGPLLPAFHAYGYGVGALLHGIEQTLRHTCRFERLEVAAPGARIECIWHEHLPAYIAAYLPPAPGRCYAWMNHPVWYMRPVHVLLAWSGVETLALGSTGHGGQAALDRVVEYVREGYSTSVAVDGPSGPAHVLRRGALDMALRTGAPLVAIHFEYERAVRVGGWDRKHYPLPYSRVRVLERGPFWVNAQNYESVREALASALG